MCPLLTPVRKGDDVSPVVTGVENPLVGHLPGHRCHRLGEELLEAALGSVLEVPGADTAVSVTNDDEPLLDSHSQISSPTLLTLPSNVQALQ